MQIVCERRGPSPLFSFCWRECHRASLSMTTGNEARHTPTRGGEEAVMEGGREVWRKEEGQRVSRKEGGAPSGPPCSCSGGEEECIKERMLISSLGGGPTADHSLQGQTEVWRNKIQVPVFCLPNHQHQQCFAGGQSGQPSRMCIKDTNTDLPLPEQTRPGCDDALDVCVHVCLQT